ncbi:MAG: hypothetical protein ACE5I1_26430, partial [bacterium]
MSHPITLFHKIIHPLWQFVENSEYHPTDDPAKILDFRAFIRILLYYYLGDADSARSLINDLNNDEECVLEAGLTPCGLSTIHDAFARYANGLFQRLYQALLQKIPMPSIKEFNELGKLTCVDSSV